MNANILLFSILFPVVAGGICFFIKLKWVKEAIAIAISVILFALSIFLFVAVRDVPLYWSYAWLPQMNIDFSLRCYGFSSIILLFISFFALLTCLYSANFMKNKKRAGEYYTYLLLTLGISWGVILANNLVVFLLFWGILALLLYAFLSLGSLKLATKGIFTMGVADFALILGALFLFKLSGSLNMDTPLKIELTGALPLSAFILLATGAIAKMGSIPFHTWIPDASREAPLPVMAYLPASLDKLLGVYLLFRISSDFFNLSATSLASFYLMLIGAFTIVVAVMMALVSADMKKVIAYLNISAAGYMMMGIGTANPVGIAGGLFYLLSTTVWTSLLFFAAGSVENQTGTSDFSSLGKVARWMPLTFAGTLVGGLAISGVPPFNGFFSKWMIYQGIIQLTTLGGVGRLWIVWLVAAMFGSVVTLASFIRMFYSVFLGEVGLTEKRRAEELSLVHTFSNPGLAPEKKVEEVGMTMNFPVLFLACLCAIFGIFAYELPLKFFVLPFVAEMPPVASWVGWWEPELATILMIVGLVVGILIYLFSKVKLGREDITYIGGEEPRGDMILGGIGFSDTVANFVGIRRIYAAGQKGLIDIYQGMLAFSRAVGYFLFALDRLADYLWRGLAYVVLFCGKAASLAHNGILHNYLAWFLLGLVILILVFCL
ncbi:hypothetical protein IBX65_05890 [Candidatus Aerophobetes bacterium]|nr:hypothetical protein [Candidatus Aerophobetes bacterium]